MVEIFETVEGEGRELDFRPCSCACTVAICAARRCDTPYSYAPAKPERTMSIAEIVACECADSGPGALLTGGEPLMYGERSPR